MLVYETMDMQEDASDMLAFPMPPSPVDNEITPCGDENSWLSGLLDSLRSDSDDSDDSDGGEELSVMNDENDALSSNTSLYEFSPRCPSPPSNDNDPLLKLEDFINAALARYSTEDRFAKQRYDKRGA